MVFDHLIKFFTSLKLTVVCLGFAIVLVFLGTLAQVDLGLYKAQNEFFRSFLVFWGPKSATWRIPILPGGYLVGGVLLINLVSSHIMRFKLTRSKIGIWLTHFGLILLAARATGHGHAFSGEHIAFARRRSQQLLRIRSAIGIGGDRHHRPGHGQSSVDCAACPDAPGGRFNGRPSFHDSGETLFCQLECERPTGRSRPSRPRRPKDSARVRS